MLDRETEAGAKRQDLTSIVARLGQPRVLVIGDPILDRFVECRTTDRIDPASGGRVCRIVEATKRDGGANAVANVCKSLGVECWCPRLTNSEESKTRIVIDGECVYRLDHQRAFVVISDPELMTLTRWLDEKWDAILIQDYGLGVCTPEVCRTAIDAARERGIPCVVDPARGADWKKYEGATIKCNRREERWSDDDVVVTWGERGYMIVGQREQPAHSVDVVDATGAGDAFLAALGVALGSGLSLAEACVFANAVGAVEVTKGPGVWPVTRDEVLGLVAPTPPSGRRA